MSKFSAAFTQKRRAYIYRCLSAGGAVAIYYGTASGEEVAVWLGAAAIVLNIMPILNTPTSNPPDPGEE